MALLENKYSFRLISNKNFSNSEKDINLKNEINEQKVNDSNKRSFLKILGIAGVGIAASQLIPQKAEALIMGGTPSTSVLGVRNASNTRVNPATEETLSTLATEATLSTRASESTLSAIKANSDKFLFDINGNLLTASDGNSLLALKNTDNVQINPSTDDSIILLRRILKQVDSLGVVDSAQRQKITLDAITGSLTLGTVSTVTSATNLVALGGVDGRYLYIDTARNMYANGIRSNLIYT